MAWNEPGNNNRDPWSQGPGGKRGDMPPDLADLLRRLRQRWSSGKGLGSVPVLLLVALLLLVWILSGFYTVDEQERALVMRFGAHARTDGPGLHWRLRPFEHVKTVNVGQTRQAPVQSELFTKDQDLVDVSLNVQFRISSAEQAVFNIDSADDTVLHAAQAALQQVVAGYTADEVLGAAQSGIAPKTRRLLQDILDQYHCGLQVTDVVLSQVQPPEAVQPAFADAIRAAEDAKRAHNDAQAYAGARLPTAHGDAERSIAEAQAYRDQTIARAEGDVARFDAVLQQYRKAPQVTRKRLYLETMSQIYANTGKVLVDVDKDNAGFTVPLQQILQGSGAAEAPASGNAAAAAEQPPAGGNEDNSARPRSREGR
jgi:membrane protease subunit HflK